MREPNREVQPTPEWDASRVRMDFPNLAGGDMPPTTYFDGPAGSQLPWCVLRSLEDASVTNALPSAQVAFADWLGGAPQEFIAGPSMTLLALHAARALAPQWKHGDNIVLTQQDHCANARPWTHAAEARGVEVRWVRVDSAGSLDLTDLAHKVTKRTRLLAISAASNVLGTINDVPRIISMVRRKGPLVFVDAVHFAAHRLGDAARWDCDFLAASAYKFYGPKVAALWMGKRAQDALSERTSAALLSRPLLEPEGADPISPALLSGVPTAIDYLADKSPGLSRRQKLEQTMASVTAHEHRLLERLWEGLSTISAVRMIGPLPSAERTATAAFVVDGVAATRVCELLARRRILLGCGHFNAASLVEALGHGGTGVLRAGCMMYSTPDEVDLLVSTVRDVGKQRGG